MGNRLRGLALPSWVSWRLGRSGLPALEREGKVLLMVSPRGAGTSFVQVPESAHAALEVTAGLQGAELPRSNTFRGESDQARALTLTPVTVLLPMAPQRVVPDKGGTTLVTLEGPLGGSLGPVVGATLCVSILALWDPAPCLGPFPVHSVHVFGQAAGPLRVKAAEVTFEGPVLAVNPAVHPQGSRAGARVVALGTFLRMVSLM